ncbi:MAG TPA: hypothetical protein VFB06_02375 [Streptosporangiaceae bacterium]|nr:hypothetical protein [Streptosporangiaceae bacterium]
MGGKGAGRRLSTAPCAARVRQAALAGALIAMLTKRGHATEGILVS